MIRSIFNFFLLAVLVIQSPLSFAEDKELQLSDLGFKTSDTTATPELQTALDDRRFYLRQHQVWALVAAGAMVGTILTAGEESVPPEHPFMAGLAVASYAAAAYTAWKAPDLPSGKVHGGTAWHRRLAWVHVPGMIITPILGYLAAKKIQDGKEPGSPEDYHSTAAFVTAGALALSALSISFEF